MIALHWITAATWMHIATAAAAALLIWIIVKEGKPWDGGE